MAIKEPDWNTCRGLMTQCYRNLNQKGVMSVRQQIDKSWLVVGHSENLALRNVIFQVSQASRDRVIRSGRKNVHAYAVGTLIDLNSANLPQLQEIHYCPFSQTTFTWKESGERIDKADLLIVDRSRVYCSTESIQSQLTLFQS
jgi:hypothetical protein